MSCYYNSKTCTGEEWECLTCHETYCEDHSHNTDTGSNVECLACERERETQQETDDTEPVKQIERKILITYRWWDETEIQEDHVSQLEEAGKERALEMMQEGFTSGELNASFEDNGKETEYRGWFEINTTVI